MIRKGLILLTVMACCGCGSNLPPAPPNPPPVQLADALAQCRSACRDLKATASLERRSGSWQVIRIDVESDPTGEDLHRLTGLTTLESLSFWKSNKLPNEHVQDLGSLRSLREINLPEDAPPAALEAIQALPNLESLHLDNCSALGPDVLAHLGGLPKLRRLDVAGLKLTDKAVMDLKSLDGLVELHFYGDTEITDANLTKLKGLSSLRVLTLASDQITDKGLEGLASLPNLRDLDLRGRQVTGRGLGAFQDSLSLEELTLGPSITPDGADFSFLRGLKSLDIRDLSREALAQTRLPAGLEQLYMIWVTDIDARRLGELKQLKRATLGWGGGRSDVEGLFAISALEELSLITSPGWRADRIAALPSLRALTLDGCGFSPDSMTQVGRMSHLQSLTIKASLDITDEGLAHLGDLADLTRLKLGSPMGNATPNGFAFLRRLVKLRVLSVHLADLQRDSKAPMDALLLNIQPLTELEELSCTGGVFTDEGLSTLAALKKLRRLDLSYCQGFTDAGLAVLVQVLPALEVLTLTYAPPPPESPSAATESHR